MADHISVGILRKPHGLSGAFNFSLTRELKSVKKHPAHFFIEGKGGFIPYFIVSFDLKDMFTGLLTFEDIDSVEKAKQMTGCELYLDEKTVGSLFKKDQDDYGFLIGYAAWDGERALGTVAAIEEMPGQVLAVIDMAGEEVMVPLADDLVAEVDKRKKKIVFELPEGLV